METTDKIFLEEVQHQLGEVYTLLARALYALEEIQDSITVWRKGVRRKWTATSAESGYEEYGM